MKASEIQALLDEPACDHNKKEKSGLRQAQAGRHRRRMFLRRRADRAAADRRCRAYRARADRLCRFFLG